MTRRHDLTRPPLEIPEDDWRARWQVLPSWRVLHRISEIEWECDDDRMMGDGVAVCGASGSFCIPGFLSRLGLPRCKHCCRALGIPSGNGCPENEGIST